MNQLESFITRSSKSSNGKVEWSRTVTAMSLGERKRAARAFSAASHQLDRFKDFTLPDFRVQKLHLFYIRLDTIYRYHGRRNRIISPMKSCASKDSFVIKGCIARTLPLVVAFMTCDSPFDLPLSWIQYFLRISSPLSFTALHMLSCLG